MKPSLFNLDPLVRVEELKLRQPAGRIIVSEGQGVHWLTSAMKAASGCGFRLRWQFPSRFFWNSANPTATRS